VYQRWLVEDVRWIITPEEQIAFLRLSNDADRDRFIEQFWDRRNPHPDRPGNPFKDEHYRRIAYTNAHFASAGVPGWETDRGRIYILYGPPDRIHDGYTNTADRKPAQRWHYHFVGPYDVYDKDFRFVDVCNCGDYRLVAGRSEEPRLGP
jgi:GWxTD domain-containing protein